MMETPGSAGFVPLRLVWASPGHGLPDAAGTHFVIAEGHGERHKAGALVLAIRHGDMRMKIADTGTGVTRQRQLLTHLCVGVFLNIRAVLPQVKICADLLRRLLDLDVVGILAIARRGNLAHRENLAWRRCVERRAVGAFRVLAILSLIGQKEIPAETRVAAMRATLVIHALQHGPGFARWKR